MEQENLVRAYLHLPARGKAAVLWHLLRDPRVPWYAKALVPAIVLYLVTPIDIIPDFIPVLGHLDDALVVVLGLGFFVRLCPPGLLEEHVSAWHERQKDS